MIPGVKVKNPTKQQLATDIARALRIPAPGASTGSSIDSTFLDRIHVSLGYSDTAGPDAYRKAERVLQDVGLTYDPYWDTSESQEKGGSTVTNRAFSRIRTAVTGVSRCFLLNTTDAPAGAKWETDHKSTYRYDNTVTGRGPLNDAGPGSRIIFYSTSKSTHHPKHFIAYADVDYIAPGWTGPWEAVIGNYTELASPVPEVELVLPSWNHQHAITEVTWDTYKSILIEGAADYAEAFATANEDAGGGVVAQRVMKDFPAAHESPVIVVPDALPSGVFTPAPLTAPMYTESADGIAVTTSGLPPRPTNEANSKLAEKRAVELTTRGLEASGWTLDRDCQRDGVGYDLRFSRSGRELHVEVKGVQSANLVFNLTPKECWRLEQDPAFVVVAVTNVLSPHSYKLYLLTRDQLATAKRIVTGYRLSL